LLVMSSGSLLAQYTWTKYEGNPVFPSGPSGSWYRGLFTPCVLFNADSSRFEMWFAASTNAGGARPWQIGFTKSIDGIVWTVPEIVLSPRAGNWDNYSLQSPFVIRENGQYKMWYTSEGPNYTTFKIGYATSPDGVNWNRLDNPIFEAGTQSWEAGGVGTCCVMPITGGYKMWYVGATTAGVNGKQCLGYATSIDGISWQRDTLNNPVLEPGDPGEWDDYWLMLPRVLFIDDLYYMWYGAAGSYFGDFRVGLATSIDGINWTKFWDNPVLKPSVSGWDNGGAESGSVVMIGDSLFMFYDGSNASLSAWQIGLATSQYFPNALPPGIYTIGNSGSFATIQDAFDKLETDGVAGNITLELVDDLYTAPVGQYGFLLNGPIPGAGPNSRVIIKPAENKNVVIQHDGSAVFYLVNTSYVNFDGIGTTGSTTLTVQAIHNVNFPYNEGIIFMNNSDHNVIQNITFIIEDYLRDSGSGFFSTQTGSAPDSNLIQNNFVKQAGFSLYIYNTMTGVMGKGNILRGNRIGSETDSLVASGIQVTRCENTLIENNIIQNLKVTIPGVEKGQAGIASTFGSGDIIRNNVIHNLKASSGYFCTGIFLFAMAGYFGDNIHIYNNMIYDIQSTSTQTDSRVSGIGIVNHNNSKVYYNSINLSGTGENKLGSAALYIYNNCSNTEVKNNILVNTRDESPYCASAIYNYTAANLTSDYNDLYYDNTNANNCLVRIGSTNYLTLADWQVTTQDLHSYVEMPNFVDPYLEIDPNEATYLESRGIPISGIDTDYEGDARNATTPDIGADEFDGVMGIEDEETIPTEYALEQNYPNPFNPSTKISWQLPVGSQQTLKIYDVLGNEITTLIDEYKPAGRYEIEFNASSLPSGVYFYQLKAREFISTKKMILIR
jgi:predicted GH43/DUF377 family glycosyl hydrolase